MASKQHRRWQKNKRRLDGKRARKVDNRGKGFFRLGTPQNPKVKKNFRLKEALAVIILLLYYATILMARWLAGGVDEKDR